MRCSLSNFDYFLFTRLGITITLYYLDMSHTLAKCEPAEVSMPVKSEISGAELTSDVKLHDSDEQGNMASPPSPLFFSSRGQIITTTEVAIDANSNLRFVRPTLMHSH